MLARVRGALGEGAAPPAVPRGYRGVGVSDGADAVERFCERVRDYGAAAALASGPRPSRRSR